MNGVKIQINSLEALERLIGGDSELEIELRNSIIQSFTNKHLKGIANTILDKGFAKDFEKELKENFFSAKENGIFSMRLQNKYKELVDKEVTNGISVMIRESIRTIVTKELVHDAIKNRVNYEVHRIVDRVDKKLIEKKALLLVEKLLKENID
jgi:Glu-tRNA(Gln) amidotransferase subunit E-like FAD-binding protein